MIFFLVDSFSENSGMLDSVTEFINHVKKKKKKKEIQS